MCKKLDKIGLAIFFSVLFLFFFSSFNSNFVYAELQPSLVKDVNKVPSGEIKYVTSLNDEIYFQGYDDYKGSELWKSDGTEEGTVIVKDIREGLMSSSPSNLVKFGEYIYFSASNGSNGVELWKSDGTESGTVMVKDIRSGINSGFPENLFVLGETLYFSASNGSNGVELWKSDGTESGTVMVKDIKSGSYGSLDSFVGSSKFVAIGNILFFPADNGTNGYELWRSDGTTDGTYMVKDIYAGSSSGVNPNNVGKNLVVINGILYFPGNSSSGSGLWRSDGTTDGTYLVSSASSNLTNFVDYNGNLLFRANSSQLWKSDGTESGTVMIKDIDINPDFSTFIDTIFVSGLTIYMSGDDGYHGSELWKSDGTESGTVMLKDINGSEYDIDSSSFPGNFVNFNGATYFVANEPEHGLELWKTDGTESGTELFKDIYEGSESGYPGNFLVLNSHMYFSAQDENSVDLWVTDGTQQGTKVVKVVSIATNSSEPGYFGSTDEALYFKADDWIHGVELWRTDGTEEGTYMVKDINPGDEDGFFRGIEEMYSISSILYFVATDGIHGEELWKSDGTEKGTVMVKDIDEYDSNPLSLSSLGNVLFFTAYTELYGYELWKSDGTEEGTVMIKDIAEGGSNSLGSDYELTPMGDNIYFVADDGYYGSELWKSDGTSEGTVMVRDIRSGSSGSFPSNLFVIGETLYFTANDGTSGVELWKSDGTSVGTVLVKDIRTGSSSSSPSQFAYNNGYLYFSANNGTSGYELWKSDGTVGGTVMVKDIYTGSNSSYVDDIASLNNNIYFVAQDGVHGYELWKSDGTESGTVMVKDIYNVPSESSFPTSIISFDNKVLYFAADDGINGSELWQSDGTEEGTKLVVDLMDGTYDSLPENITSLNGTVFFSANTPLYGNELWMLTSSVIRRNINPPSGSTITTATPSISFETNTNAYCRLSLTDENYDDMSDDIICSGEGTTSHTCVSSNLGDAGEKKLYISCSNGSDFKDTISTNEDIVYLYENEEENGGEDEEEGGGGEEDNGNNEIPMLPIVRITRIGYLLNIPDNSYLQYFYSQKSVNIQGIASANSEVVFTINSKEYITIADKDGNFSITIPLYDGINTISYISRDSLSNLSNKKILRLIINNVPEVNDITIEDDDTDNVLPPVENTEEPIKENDNNNLKEENKKKDKVLGEKIVDFIKTLEITEDQSKNVAVGSLIAIPALASFSLSLGNTYIAAHVIRVSSYILGLFRIGKRKRNCGLVYDSITKEPLQNAIVRIFSLEDKLIATEVTNEFGIFESSLDSGTYKLIVDVNGYTFPSNLVSGNQDLSYKNIYRGGEFNLSNHPISYSIPVDPINKTISQEVKTALKSKISNILVLLTNFIMFAGLLFSIIAYVKVSSTFNLILLLLYVFLLLFSILMNNKGKYKFGIVRDVSNEVVDGVRLSLIETEFRTNYADRITDDKGKYRFIVPGGKYKLVLNDPNYEILSEKELTYYGKEGKLMVISDNITTVQR